MLYNFGHILCEEEVYENGWSKWLSYLGGVWIVIGWAIAHKDKGMYLEGMWSLYLVFLLDVNNVNFFLWDIM